MYKVKPQREEWQRWWAWYKVTFREGESIVSVRWEYVMRRKWYSSSGSDYWDYRTYTDKDAQEYLLEDAPR